LSRPVPHRAGRPVGRYLDESSPEALFVISAIAQYVGATIAITLFDQVDPASVAWFRVIGAAIALLAVSGRSLRRGFTRRDLAAAAVFGIATALMNLLFYLAIDRLPLGKGVAIEFIGPICVAAAQTRTRRNALALGLAALGVGVLSGFEIAAEPLGLLFIFGASAMWAVYIVVGSRVARLDRGVAGLGIGLAIGALVITPFGAPGSGPAWHSFPLLGACLVVGVFSNAIGYGIDQHVLRRIPVRRFSVMLALLPVTATVVALIALGQRPSGIDLGGMALVLAAVALQERDVVDPAGTA
jgi:inner membrane transporter RhtA